MEFKKDKFSKSRNNYSRMMEISCALCESLICKYQKDGSGPLKRLYIDRTNNLKTDWKKNRKFVCGKCKTWLGVATIYQKENRKCIFVFQEAIKKRIIKK